MSAEIKSLEQAVEQVSGELGKKYSDLKSKYDELQDRIAKRDEEMKSGKWVAKDSDEYKAFQENAKRADEIADELKRTSEMVEILQKSHDEMKEEAEKQFAKMNRPGFNVDGSIKTPGEIFTESVEFKNMIKNKLKHSDTVIMEGFDIKKISRKALTSAAASMGALAQETILLRPDPFYNPNRPMHIRELMTVYPCNGNAIEYIQETGFYNLSTTLTVAGVPADVTLDVSFTGGMYVGQVLTLTEGANTQNVTIAALPAGVNGGPGQLSISAIGGAHTFTVAGTQVTSTTFAPTPETYVKPEMDLKTTLQTANVRTIASYLEVSRQILDDAPRLRAYIDNRMGENLMNSEDRQLLYGSGTAPDIQGILAAGSGVQSYSWSSGAVGDTRIDAILKAAVLASVAEYPVEAVGMNFIDHALIRAQKGTDGHYVLAMDQSNQVWQIPIALSNAFATGDFLVGAFSMGAEVYDRQQLTMRMSDSHNDLFRKNMTAMIMENQIGMGIVRPDAFVNGSWDSAPVGP